MYARILVPVDGSDNASAVLPFAGVIAKAVGARVELLRITENLEDVLRTHVGHLEEDVLASGDVSIDNWDQVQASHDQDALHSLETLAQSLTDDGVTVETKVVQGDAAHEIIEAADAVPDTLVAMSTHGRSGVTRWLLGSVTDKVVHHASTSTLVVRGKNVHSDEGHASLTRVILPLDGSPISEAAIPHAEALAKTLGVGITVIRAASLGTYASFGVEQSIAYPDDYSSQVQEAAADYAEEVAKAIRLRGVTEVDVHVPDGTPQDSILSEVGETGDKLVVLGSHGRSGPSRWVLGSVADQVVRHSPGPVLVVRREDDS